MQHVSETKFHLQAKMNKIKKLFVCSLFTIFFYQTLVPFLNLFNFLPLIFVEDICTPTFPLLSGNSSNVPSRRQLLSVTLARQSFNESFGFVVVTPPQSLDSAIGLCLGAFAFCCFFYTPS